jgi:imidazolonepropionase
MRTLIKNIKSLVLTEEKPQLKVSGKEMSQLSCLDNAWLAMDDDLISGFGTMDEWEGIADWHHLTVIDASDKLVLPCWCDSHTHVVFAGSREGEFVDKIRGASYEEIARKGGGILNSARRLQQTSEEELVQQALGRLHEIMKMGTGAVEIKSGYGLTVEDELKILRVIRRLKELAPLEIKATFLGAHAEYKEKREKYIDLVIQEMLPRVAEEKLADYCDVFCEKGFFSPDETGKILEAAVRYGLKAKIHANQLGISGGVQVGVQHQALSVDHLEYMGDEEIAVLQGAVTMPTLLPSAAFFLDMQYPPARRMIDAGLPVSLATDYNPGSSPSGRMSFVVSLACIKMKMTPEEAIHAATLNAAYAMDLSATHGSIAVGKKANVIITKEIPHYNYIPYAFGSDVVDEVIINGKVISALVTSH